MDDKLGLNVGAKLIAIQNGLSMVVTVTAVHKTYAVTSNGLKIKLSTGEVTNVVGLSVIKPTPEQLHYQLTVEAVKRVALEIQQLNFLALNPTVVAKCAKLMGVDNRAVDYLLIKG